MRQEANILHNLEAAIRNIWEILVGVLEPQIVVHYEKQAAGPKAGSHHFFHVPLSSKNHELRLDVYQGFGGLVEISMCHQETSYSSTFRGTRELYHHRPFRLYNPQNLIHFLGLPKIDSFYEEPLETGSSNGLWDSSSYAQTQAYYNQDLPLRRIGMSWFCDDYPDLGVFELVQYSSSFQLILKESRSKEILFSGHYPTKTNAYFKALGLYHNFGKKVLDLKRLPYMNEYQKGQGVYTHFN